MDHRQTIQKSIDYIEDNLKTEIRAQELADMAHFSLYHYYRLFHAATGLPVMQYILRRRLLHGIYAVKQGSSGIEAALNYGFDTYAGFYKAFQREFGCTPSEFLRSSRAKRPYRLNLFREECIRMNHKNAREILRHWNMEEASVSDVYYDGTGNKNDHACYVGNSYVLKYTANLGKLQTHIAVSREMEKLGLWAAVPVATADGRDYVQAGELYACLTKRLPGKQVTADTLYVENGPEKARSVGEILGQLHLALKKVEVCCQEADLLETVRTWALPKAGACLGWDTDTCQAWLERFAHLYPQLPRQLIHRDPNPGNMICGEDRWGFLDFELSECNARLFDPCYAATAILSETGGEESKWEQWIGIYRNLLLGYDHVAKLTDAEKQAAPHLLIANQLVCVAWFAEQEKYEELLAINKRMTLWLAAHLEALALD